MLHNLVRFPLLSVTDQQSILGKANLLARREGLNASREPGYEEPTFKAVWGLFGAQGLYDFFLEGVSSVRVWQSLCDTGDVENLRSAGDPVTAASNDIGDFLHCGREPDLLRTPFVCSSWDGAWRVVPGCTAKLRGIAAKALCDYRMA